MIIRIKFCVRELISCVRGLIFCAREFKANYRLLLVNKFSVDC